MPYHHAVNDRSPKFTVELRDQFIGFVHFKHECADGIRLCFPLFALLPKFLDLVADGDVAVFIAFVLPAELRLIHSVRRILLDKLSCESRDHFCLLQEVCYLAVNLRGVGQHLHHPFAVIQNVFSVRDKSVIIFFNN